MLLIPHTSTGAVELASGKIRSGVCGGAISGVSVDVRDFTVEAEGPQQNEGDLFERIPGRGASKAREVREFILDQMGRRTGERVKLSTVSGARVFSPGRRVKIRFVSPHFVCGEWLILSLWFRKALLWLFSVQRLSMTETALTSNGQSVMILDF